MNGLILIYILSWSGSSLGITIFQLIHVAQVSIVDICLLFINTPLFSSTAIRLLIQLLLDQHSHGGWRGGAVVLQRTWV